MDAFQEQLAEQVRLYKHLYDSSSRDHRDNHMILNSWREIASTLGKDEVFCRKMWKNMRDRYVKAKRKIYSRSRDYRGGVRVVPPILTELDWLSRFTKHRETEGDRPRCAQVNKESMNFDDTLEDPMSLLYPRLPLSSLHLLVSPLRLMSACMWQVAQERNVDQYDKLAEFITLVTDTVPELLNYKQKTQLILGLRARLILEVLKRIDKVDCEAIQDHLNIFQQKTTNMYEEDLDGEVEISKSAFVELVQILLRDQSEKDKYFKEIFPVQYGARFDTSLQILVWEFFSRLEEFLPVPSFSQVFSMFDICSFDYEFDKFVSDPEDLRRILQHQKERQKMTTSGFTLMSDTILSTLASRQTVAASGDRINPKISQKILKQEDNCSGDDFSEDDEESDDSSTATNPDSRLSTLASSLCYEETGVAGDDETAENKEPSEENINKALTEGSTDVSTNSRGADENTCLECGKTFSSRSYMKKHSAQHSLVRPFRCSHCNKSYASQKDLNRHFLIHSRVTIQPYACNLCEKKFWHQQLLIAHLQNHSRESPYACTLCDKKFTQSCPCTMHLRVHNKETPYLCSTCGMSFCSSEALLVHSRFHTWEQPHQCDLCGKGFATFERLTVHWRSHTGERPYSCSHCDKSFDSSTGLKKHTRTHGRETSQVLNVSQDIF